MRDSAAQYFRAVRPEVNFVDCYQRNIMLLELSDI